MLRAKYISNVHTWINGSINMKTSRTQVQGKHSEGLALSVNELSWQHIKFYLVDNPLGSAVFLISR